MKKNLSCEDAYKILKKNEEIDENTREMLMNYLAISPSNCYSFIVNFLFKNDEELQRVKRTILISPSYSLLLLQHYPEFVNDDEKDEFIETVCRDPVSSCKALRLLSLTPEQHAKCFKSIVINFDETKRYLREESFKVLEEEQKYILNFYEYNDDIIKQMAEYCTQENSIREYLRSYIFSNSDFSLLLAIRKKLNDDELKIVYDKYSDFYVEKFKRKMWHYIDFAKAFEKYLNLEQKKILFQKLKNKSCRNMLTNWIPTLDLPQDMKDKLYSLIIMDKLQK